MSDLYGYDFADPQVRDLIVGNHTPMEQVIYSAEGATLRPVVCERCQHSWPCPPIVGYRLYRADAGADTGLKTDTSPYDE